MWPPEPGAASGDGRLHHLTAQRRQLELLALTLEREADVVAREPVLLAPHLHNMLLLDQRGDDEAAPVLERARVALSGRPWLSLANRPSADRSAHTRTLQHGNAEVLDLAWSPAGRLLASLARRRRGAHEWITLGSFKDGRLVPEADTGDVWIFNVLTGATEGRIRQPCTALAWSPDGELLAVALADHSVGLWDRFGILRQTLGAHDVVLALSWSPDGTLLASAGHDQAVRLWVWDQPGQSIALEGHGDLVAQLAWSPDGTLLASASKDNTVRVWDPHRPRPVAILQGHTGDIQALTWSPRGTLLASAGKDETVRVWDPRQRTWLRRRWQPIVHQHTREVSSLAWSPDGGLLASAAHDGTVRLWNPGEREAAGLLQGHTDQVAALAWSPDGTLLASAAHDGTVRLWNRDRIETTPEQHAGAVTAVAWPPDGSVLASASDDTTVRWWDPVSGSCDHVFQLDETIRSLAWSADGKWLAMAGAADWVSERPMRHSVHLRTREGESSAELRGHTGDLYALAWSPREPTLAVGGADHSINLWGLAMEQLVKQQFHTRLWPTTGGLVVSVAWSPDGTRLAAADSDGALYVWDVSRVWQGTSTLIAVTRAHEGFTPALTWSPDGALIAAASFNDRMLRIWELTVDGLTLRGSLEHASEQETTPVIPYILSLHAGLMSQTFFRHARTDPLGKGGVQLAWSPDGSVLAAASWEPEVRLWHRSQPPEASVSRVARHEDRIGALTWSPDGRLLASGDAGGTIHVWDPATGQARASAHCLGYVLGLRFGSGGRVLQVVDDGGATGNRPLSYTFELNGIDLRPAGPPPAGRAAEERPAHRSTRRRMSLQEALDRSGLGYDQIEEQFLVPPIMKSRIVVQARELLDEWVAFLLADPPPARHSNPAALHNLLRISFEAEHVRAMQMPSGQIAFGCQLPTELVTPERVAGLILGLLELGITADDLLNPGRWRPYVDRCSRAQASRMGVDVGRVEAEIRELTQEAKLTVRPDPSASLVVESRFAGAKQDLFVRVTPQAVSLVLPVEDLLPPPLPADHLHRLLRLNNKPQITKVGLRQDGTPALLYQVPVVTPLLFEQAQAAFEQMLAKLATDLVSDSRKD